MKLNSFLVGLIFMSTSNCAHTATRAPAFACDTVYSSGVSYPFNPPYWLKMSSSEGTLLFVAAAHGEEPENNKTFNLIRAAYAQNSPKFVIVEGLETSRGNSPQSYIDEVRLGKRRLAEPAFTALEAHRKSIPFVGGEISDQELFSYLSAKGFSQKDMGGFYALRIWVKRRDISINTILRSRDFPIKDMFSSFNDFENWFKNITGVRLTRDAKWALPFQGRSDRLQTLANEVTFARDQHLTDLLKDSIRSHKNVLAVYGAGHAPVQKCFLSTSFSGSAFSEGETL